MFTGFTQDAIDFLMDLRFHNDQTFYEANKERYETLLKEPLRALCEEMAPIIRRVDPALDTRPSRTMSRIRRDTRFSKDKSPFRDHVWLSWRYPGESRSEGFDLYWGFGPDWYSWGCGMYASDKPVMDALRLHIRRHPEEVRALFMAPEIRDRYAIYGERYVRLAVPEDVPDDLRDLYVRRGFGIENIPDPSDWKALFSRECAERLAREITAMAPLQRFMRQMRLKAEAAQQAAVREREAKARAQGGDTRVIIARREDEFEF